MSLVSHCKVIQLWIPKCLKPFRAPLIYTGLVYCLPCCPHIYKAIFRFPCSLQHFQREPILYQSEIICQLFTVYMYLPTIALELVIHVPLLYYINWMWGYTAYYLWSPIVILLIQQLSSFTHHLTAVSQYLIPSFVLIQGYPTLSYIDLNYYFWWENSFSVASLFCILPQVHGKCSFNSSDWAMHEFEL